MVNAPNFIESTNTAFCKSMIEFEQNVIENSTIVTGASTFFREKLISDIEDQVEKLKKEA